MQFRAHISGAAEQYQRIPLKEHGVAQGRFHEDGGHPTLPGSGTRCQFFKTAFSVVSAKSLNRFLTTKHRKRPRAARPDMFAVQAGCHGRSPNWLVSVQRRPISPRAGPGEDVCCCAARSAREQPMSCDMSARAGRQRLISAGGLLGLQSADRGAPPCPCHQAHASASTKSSR